MSDEAKGGGEKTEAATQKRLSDSAKKGDVLQSKELGTAISILTGALFFALFGQILIQSLAVLVTDGLQVDAADLEEFNPCERTAVLVLKIVLPLGGLFATTIVAAILTPALLGSLGFRWSAVKPKTEKINPLAGIKRILGIRGLIELGKAIAKIVLLGSIGLSLVYLELGSLFAAGSSDDKQAIGEFGRIFLLTVGVMSLGLLIVAGIDVPAQLMQRNKRLKMSKQEIKDENKEVEGSPEVKSNLRMRQQQILTQSARKALEEATVVLTNPSHFAVVLQYRTGLDSAPKVLARGRGGVALSIKKLAGDRSVPVLEYPELTRAIYFTTPVGGIIDDRLYLAVATVLAFLFRLDAQLASEHDRPEIDLPGELKFDGEGNLSS